VVQETCALDVVIAAACTFATANAWGVDEGLLAPLTNPAQPLVRITKQLRIAEPTAHTNPFMIVFTFVTFYGVGVSSLAGAGGWGPTKMAVGLCPISA
jgi:hypothetical protein